MGVCVSVKELYVAHVLIFGNLHMVGPYSYICHSNDFTPVVFLSNV